MAKKYYAVRVGKTPGIYLTWDDCKAMTSGYPGAVFKSFTSLQEAEAFVGGVSVEDTNEKSTIATGSVKEPYAFVDGSYNKVANVYGYGGFLMANGEKYVLQGSGNEAELVEMNNVAGEIAGAMAAVNKALELGLKELDSYYDYMGIFRVKREHEFAPIKNKSGEDSPETAQKLYLDYASETKGV